MMVLCDRGHDHPAFVHNGITFVARVGTCHIVYTRVSDKERTRRPAAPLPGTEGNE